MRQRTRLAVQQQRFEYATAMLTTISQDASAPLHTYAASPTIEKEPF
jgi:hypothetical protein